MHLKRGKRSAEGYQSKIDALTERVRLPKLLTLCESVVFCFVYTCYFKHGANSYLEKILESVSVIYFL